MTSYVTSTFMRMMCPASATMTTLKASLMLLGLVVMNAQASAEAVSVEVILPNIGPNGKSLDGGRIYLLPWEITTESPPEPAICVSTDTGEIACAPNIGSADIPCPDSYKCLLSVELRVPFKAFTVSIYDIDGLPKDILDNAENLVARGRTAAADLTGHSFEDGAFEDAVDRARDAAVAWTWIESVSFVQLNENVYYPKGDPLAEKLARKISSAVAPWQLLRFERGRIKAPFETMSLEECMAPLPPCIFNYVQISIREGGGT